MKKYLALLLAVVCISCATKTRVVAVDGGDYQTTYIYKDRVVARDRAWKRASHHCHKSRKFAVVVKEDVRPNGNAYVSEIRYACR
jgi:uncharacterized lipoprotein YehR (DUF1307 family)